VVVMDVGEGEWLDAGCQRNASMDDKINFHSAEEA
jgi:hypothetical protein